MLDLNQALNNLTHTPVFTVTLIILIVIGVIAVALIAWFIYDHEDGIAMIILSIAALLGFILSGVLACSHDHSVRATLDGAIHPWAVDRYGLDLGENIMADIVADFNQGDEPEGKTYIANTAEGESVEISYAIIDDHLKITTVNSAEEYPRLTTSKAE